MTGNILFPGNPYPSGHSIKEFRFFAIEENDNTVTLQIRLITEDYHESKPTTDSDNSDWSSTTVWENYGHCTLSSVDWDYSGFKIADNANGFNTDSLNMQTFQVDDVADLAESGDDDIESHAFGIYLLGHDACAGHDIQFLKNEDGSFDIDWNGKIALAYAGEDEYDYDFKAQIKNAKFEGLVARSEVNRFVFGS